MLPQKYTTRHFQSSRMFAGSFSRCIGPPSPLVVHLSNREWMAPRQFQGNSLGKRRDSLAFQ